MIKKMFRKVQKGFTPLELLMVVGISAVVAGLFIFAANTPQQMAQLPAINVNVEAPNVNVAQAPSRTPGAKAIGDCDDTLNGGNAADVQAAVTANYGGTLCLTGTFNFGTTDSILIVGDINILGEADNQGNPLTTINGGKWTFSVDNEDADVEIKHLWFDGANRVAIEAKNYNSVDISNNKITDMMPIGPTSNGIRLGDRANVPAVLPSCTTTSVKDNYIDMETAGYPDTGSRIGVWLAYCKCNEADISNNKIENYNRMGVALFDLFYADQPEPDDNYCTVDISRNELTSSLYSSGPPIPGVLKTNMGFIYNAGWYNSNSDDVEVNFKHNDVTIQSYGHNDTPNARGAAIASSSSNTTISDNHFEFVGDYAQFGVISNLSGGSAKWKAFGLGAKSHDNVIRNNTFRGNVASRAINIINSDSYLILGNNFDGVIGGGSVFFGSHPVFGSANNNLLVGGSGVVTDLGSGNTIKGSFSEANTPGGVGQHITCEFQGEEWDPAGGECQ